MTLRLLLLVLLVAGLAVPRDAAAWVRTLSCCQDVRTELACRGELRRGLTAAGIVDVDVETVSIPDWFGWARDHRPNATCTSAQRQTLPSCGCYETPVPLSWHVFTCVDDPDAFAPAPGCDARPPLEPLGPGACVAPEIGYQPACGTARPRPGNGATACVSWVLNEQGLALVGGDDAGAATSDAGGPDPDEIPLNELQPLLERSFATWNDVTCSQFVATYAGTTPSRQAGTRSSGGVPDFQNNVVLYRTGWPHPGLVQGLTSVTYNLRGQIVDADIELNGDTYRLGVVEDPERDRNVLDIENTMTHEVGHLLGIDHSTIENFLGLDTSSCLGSAVDESDPIDCSQVRPDRTTMFATARPGETFKRALHPDDEAAACVVYSTDGPTMICNEEAQARPVARRGCGGCASGAMPAHALAWLALLGLGRRRRRA